jgi:hypothetical protein
MKEGLIVCSLGHRFDAKRAGSSPDNPLHLDPLPLLTQDGVVKVALARIAGQQPNAETLHP